ncbi:undecaprenyl/decaprenyl-phosphate alpha-N-acetylglucosaminyl 1-phosphate transferase [Gracilibacillus caseinilyticus]|uniref:Undecaprenyl/decaprenyl-phosphate alpha-N-acetylglucosaminyl 1-phosphate transferase n=1 Tax=Gracilibacillus caseinilyticus TaxID=2932256 RepID=A0ABY4F2H9_9BACI|nr:MraY family glycosyltransferase [Gracilibacillus caseinilyticus]UOQ50283.1 undecaprenyl/decaprenyl-phosphate alpha-N-acetylglucosaminyl 1-phosphate transferase [Gracilibacillus caseinilyticus]
MQSIVYGVLAFLISCVLYIPVKKLAIYFHIIDLPKDGKIHDRPIPRIGGLAIFSSFLLTVIISPLNWKDINVWLTGAVFITLVGILDDKFTLRAIVKLFFQIAITVCLIVFGEMEISKLAMPIFGLVDLGIFGYVVTFVWIIGMINAINLIDGLDGLAAGVTMIGLTVMMMMAVFDLQLDLVIICMILIGAIAGFLIFNLHPAKIFMGDTGSLFLGYMMATIPLLGLFKQVTFFSFIIPVIILTIPIFDTLFVILKRLSNNQNIFHRDRKHLHYRLIEQGWTQKQTVFIIYGFAISFGIFSMVIAFATTPFKIVLIIIYLFIIALFARLIWNIPSETDK